MSPLRYLMMSVLRNSNYRVVRIDQLLAEQA